MNQIKNIVKRNALDDGHFRIYDDNLREIGCDTFIEKLQQIKKSLGENKKNPCFKDTYYAGATRPGGRCSGR